MAGHHAHLQPHRPAWLDDISREIEVMRHVIQKENSLLRSMCRDEMEALGQIVTSFPEPVDDAGSGAVASSRVGLSRLIEWRIGDTENQWASGLAWRCNQTFELPEYLGTLFSFSFAVRGAHRGGGDQGNASIDSPSEYGASSRLKLRLFGPNSGNFRLQVGLEVCYAERLPDPKELADGSCNSESLRVGSSESVVLTCGGSASCIARLPASLIFSASSVFLCSAHVQLLGYVSDQT